MRLNWRVERSEPNQWTKPVKWILAALQCKMPIKMFSNMIQQHIFSDFAGTCLAFPQCTALNLLEQMVVHPCLFAVNDTEDDDTEEAYLLFISKPFRLNLRKEPHMQQKQSLGSCKHKKTLLKICIKFYYYCLCYIFHLNTSCRFNLWTVILG